MKPAVDSLRFEDDKSIARRRYPKWAPPIAGAHNTLTPHAPTHKLNLKFAT